MAAKAKLPPDFVWRQEADVDAHVMYLDAFPIARVEQTGNGGWVVQTLLDVPGVECQRWAVRNAELGRGSAGRWALQRLRLIVRACGREDLAPPMEPAKRRRFYAWQRPGWAQAS
ncbi:MULTISPECIES: hypothetical protein [unclassified Pseudoxanthomonas]|uniref:hypothetical protein n=1 Tax=unclassified Pseudoxanthomonas TaxID=2645906 RepID=UPI00307DA70C